MFRPHFRPVSIILLSFLLFRLGHVVDSAPAQSVEKPEKYALLIGVAKYKHSAMNKPALEFPEIDAKALGELLKQSGYTVELLLGADATLQKIRDKLVALEQHGNDAGVVLLGLFGHGIEYESSQSAYYCPHDTVVREARDSNGNSLFDDNQQPLVEPKPESLIAMTELLTALRTCPAGNRVLLADCCRNSPNRPRGRAFGTNLQLKDVPENTAILFACSANEQAFEHADWGHGAFTRVFLEKASEQLARDGKVTMGTLADLVKPGVVALVKKRSNGRDIQSPRSLISDTVDLQLEQQGPDLLIAPFDSKQVGVAQEAWARHLKVDTGFTNTLGMKLVLIPPGEYLRGSAAADVALLLQAQVPAKPEQFADEQPQHRVRISKPFHMAKFEVTQEQFEKLLGRNSASYSVNGARRTLISGLETSEFPMETVTWYDALEFCNTLSEREGKTACYELSNVQRDGIQAIENATVRRLHGNGYRLPTEAEWEFACRAGTTTTFHFGSTVNGTEANVNGSLPLNTTKGPQLQRPTRVGRYPSNNFGLHDMCGNVWEWCEDGYEQPAYGAYSTKLAIDPTVDRNTEKATLRGGSWSDSGIITRSANRNANHPGTHNSGVGFRVICACGPKT